MIKDIKLILKISLIIGIFLVSSSNNFLITVKEYSGTKKVSKSSVTYWGYQLQNVNIQELKKSAFNLFVIDYSQDGSNDTAWTPSDLNQVKSEGKYVVSYISIGEAENYRFYWNSDWVSNPPSWLGAENPDWPGNFKVKFWEQGWQVIIYKYLDIIINQGFDGVYLDIIDAYQYYQNLGFSNADTLMMDFVHNISIYTRSKTNNNFLIIPQNGEDLLSNSSYRSFISGIGIEDMYYANNGTPSDQSSIDYKEALLSSLVNENKLVLTVDYVNDTIEQQNVYSQARSKGFIPYTTDLALDQLTPPLLVSIVTSQSNHSTSGFDLFVILSVQPLVAFYLIVKKKKNS